ncbi:FecCD family ABC transporter permease [Halobacillus karajensis]|uniref:Hemin transport system permease protein HmuU n=1 Tax=Halobacillus karajensis TaxID=195088 RepID=A0A059NWP4_9BACI|nr:iron ABC transporter permease [Halobacillus karajensis]CDQ18982.1 Hemin transport system permease protein HmuU [Halobacillus karajensis]CDQ22944.1 Hemin transport system permease protein HmuU [Halobacillus karajensis]CDQ26427.1 Hemin transport system permease protein HmuU [Halobacillus karajensis]
MLNNLRHRQLPRGLKETNLIVILSFLVLLMIGTIIFATGMGPVSVHTTTVLQILISKIPFLSNPVGNDWTQVEESIVVGLRLPRVLLGLIVGASLSVTGVALQALVRNHLADPFILGVSSGASATATLGMLFGTFSFLGTYSLSLSAFIGAVVVIVLVYALSRVNGKINMTQLLLSGVAIGLIMESITKLITLSAPNALGLHNATFWMAGSLAGAKWGYLTLPLLVMFLCMTILLLNYRALNALLAGDETAGTLGFNVNVIQTMLVLIASLLAGVTIAVSGSIGFVGLMIPHITRLLIGSDHKKVLPVSAFLGGILVVWTDVAARLIIAPEELPIGVLTAIFGGPFFIWLLKKNARK